MKIHALDAAGRTVATTTSVVDGTYQFPELLPGGYLLEFVVPVGAALSPLDQASNDFLDSDASPATGRTASFLLTSGGNADRDAGLHGRLAAARVGGMVWKDTDGDGIRDTGETRVGDVVVSLLDSSLAEIASTTTAADGSYSFAGLAADWYSLQFATPDGFTLSPMNCGNDDLLDSDANRSTGRTASFYLIAGQDDGARNAGLVVDAGTVMVKDIYLGSDQGRPEHSTDVNGTLFFRAQDQGIGIELWKSNGTLAGTTLVKDIWPGSDSAWPADLAGSDGTLFFTAEDGQNGRELWRSDGTAIGTVLVKDVYPGSESLYPSSLTVVNGIVFFVADDGQHGHELWKSDGLEAFSTDVQRSLRVTEIKSDNPEFIELKNIGPKPLDLTGVRFIDGIDFDFRLGNLSGLFPGERLVLVRNLGDFAAQYDAAEINIAGEYGGALANEGERLELVAPINRIVLEFSFDPAWYAITDHRRDFSLTIGNETADPASWNSPSNWRPSSLRGGSPGADDPRLTPDPGAVVISEIMTNPADGYNDWIELHNTTIGNIDISGWYLGDDQNGRPRFAEYQIVPGTVIPSGGYVVLTRRDQFDFGLSSYGERLQLTAGDNTGSLLGYSESVIFGGGETDVTFGPYGGDFVALSGPTMGYENADPKVGPIVINEIMYHPAYLHDEFIELYNMSAEPVDIGGWLFDGVAHQMPAGTVIPGGSCLLVVPTEVEEFRARYSIPAEVSITGPYSGALDNAGEDVALYLRDPSERRILVDRVNYDDELPWSEEADRGGGSLERVLSMPVPRAYGNDPANWQVTSVAGGTPGQQNSVAAVVDAVVDLEVKTSVDKRDPSFGQQLTFTVTLTNYGPDNATNVEVANAIPALLTDVVVTPTVGSSHHDATGLWSVPELSASIGLNAATLTITGTLNVARTSTKRFLVRQALTM